MQPCPRVTGCSTPYPSPSLFPSAPPFSPIPSFPPLELHYYVNYTISRDKALTATRSSKSRPAWRHLPAQATTMCAPHGTLQQVHAGDGWTGRRSSHPPQETRRRTMKKEKGDENENTPWLVNHCWDPTKQSTQEGKGKKKSVKGKKGGKYTNSSWVIVHIDITSCSVETKWEYHRGCQWNEQFLRPKTHTT